MSKERRFNEQVSNEAKIVIGAFIDARRKELGWSINELAEKAQIDEWTIVSIVFGKEYSIDEFIAVLGSMRGQINIGWADIESVAGFEPPSQN